MTKKFDQSWQLFKASITVTLRYRKLLWFPLVITALTTVIALFFLSAILLPIVVQHTGYRLTQKEHWIALQHYYFNPALTPHQPQDPSAAAKDGLSRLLTGHGRNWKKTGESSPWNSLCLLAGYLLSMFLATFFNVAFYSEIIAALNGKGVSIRRGLAVARSRLSSILVWSLLAGLVGWLIRAIEQRLPLVGRIVVGLLGMAWSVAAIFAIPVIIQEQPIRNPLKILKQSALTLKRTWGEGLIGYVGFSAGNLMIFAVSLVPLAIFCAVALLFKSLWIGIIGGMIWVTALLVLAYISSVASQVYRCALYLYAAEGVVPAPYSQDLLDMAWNVKKTN